MFAGPGHPASPRNRGRIARGTAAHGDDSALAPVAATGLAIRGQEAMTMKKPLYSAVLAIVLGGHHVGARRGGCAAHTDAEAVRRL